MNEAQQERVVELFARMNDGLTTDEQLELEQLLSLGRGRTKMGCDGCYTTLDVDGVDEWPSLDEAVAAAQGAGWTGNTVYCLCDKCTASRNGGEQ